MEFDLFQGIKEEDGKMSPNIGYESEEESRKATSVQGRPSQASLGCLWPEGPSGWLEGPPTWVFKADQGIVSLTAMTENGTTQKGESCELPEHPTKREMSSSLQTNEQNTRDNINNISSYTMADPNLVAHLGGHLMELAQQTGLPPTTIILSYVELLIRNDNQMGSGRAAIVDILSRNVPNVRVVPADQAGGSQNPAQNSAPGTGSMAPLGRMSPIPAAPIPNIELAAPIAQMIPRPAAPVAVVALPAPAAPPAPVAAVAPAQAAAPAVAAPVPANPAPQAQNQANVAQVQPAQVAVERRFSCRFCPKDFTRQSSANRVT
ncbi:hypothetical protein CSHISOI_10986 [Colletotrichum shisoi]|uniref:Uncharacterized protein n=1 Tax=Colletotrichum shisoi TaxID=2078593 RepID=A0A5Q4BC09_9PEZI|nr:hypothetical protein CSHISOI_10986 [Colletotrichum shisoi]